MTGLIHKCTDRFVETMIDDEAVLMDLDTADFFSLTGPAFDIWQLIDGTRDTREITAQLGEDYAVEAGDIAADVDAFVIDMLKAGFVRRD